MKQIKIRGLVIEPLVSGEKWITSDEEYHEVYLNYAERSAYINGHAVIWESVSEYTGLKDKNGKEIYEGDIISYRDRVFVEAIVIEAICFIDGGFGTSDSWLTDIGECEVNGNIYKKPELIVESEMEDE
ncbi:YopX family protein [Bacillus cereus]|nr:YopX family protein [Bacillus cereus]